MWSTRTGAARLSLLTVIGLIILKVVVGIVTGSISILAQATDSILDVLAVIITMLAIAWSAKPADEEHPFGHGKGEDIAAIVQAMLIFAAGAFIIYSAVQRIVTGTTVALTEAGIGVMLVSILASVFLSRHLHRVAHATGSSALEANARNIATDVYSAAGVIAGLIIIRFTGLGLLDPVVAIIVALVILKTAYDVWRKSFGGLVDIRLPDEEEAIIKTCITEHSSELVSFHMLRTRKSGDWRYIDLHLVMPKDASVETAHQMCDHLEQDIKAKLRSSSITIHVEPCSVECDQCAVTCTQRPEKE
ncbi:MAG: cation transporter [Chloroflexi bacterium]|nr:cation transporter [Chloroflexota bacterium]